MNSDDFQILRYSDAQIDTWMDTDGTAQKRRKEENECCTRKHGPVNRAEKMRHYTDSRDCT